MTNEDLFIPCVAHHGADLDNDHIVGEDPPPHEISSSLAVVPPFETLEPWEPIKCIENSTNLNLGLVPHLSREESFPKAPWHTPEKARPHLVAHSWSLPHYTPQSSPTSLFDEIAHGSPPPNVLSYVDFQIINHKKWKKCDRSSLVEDSKLSAFGRQPTLYS